MERKYELVKEEGKATNLFRIRALVDIPGILVRKGDIGGYVESEANLSQEGHCWLFGNAQVINGATVSENATVHDSAIICSGSEILESATIKGNAMICWNSSISGNAFIEGCVWINNSSVRGDTVIDGLAQVYGGSILHTRHIFCASRVGRESGILTVYRNSSNKLTVKRGCFTGSRAEFERQSLAVHDTKTRKAYAALLKAAELMIELE